MSNLLNCENEYTITVLIPVSLDGMLCRARTLSSTWGIVRYPTVASKGKSLLLASLTLRPQTRAKVIKANKQTNKQVEGLETLLPHLLLKHRLLVMAFI